MHNPRNREENKENNLMDSQGINRIPRPRRFNNGSIVKIVFHDFLTYDDSVCAPGHGLNVVIGPNGTGKSSVMCGICLALGSSTKVLGRSNDLGDFIKHGKESGFVEVHIWDSARHRSRIFKINIRRPNSSQYFIDNQHKKHVDVQEEVKSYNIQIDNPCTFLAQDKVKSFAEQGPQKLLANTEKAGPSDDNLLEKHQDLKEFTQQGENYEKRLDSCRKRLDTLEINLKTKKTRVENFLQRERHHNIIGLLKKKRCYLVYKIKRDDWKTAKNNFKKSAKQLEDIIGQQRPIVDNIERLKGITGQLNQNAQRMWILQGENNVKITEAMSSLSFEEKLQDDVAELERVRKLHVDWDESKRQINEQYQRLKKLYEDAQISDFPNMELERKKEHLTAVEREMKANENALAQRDTEIVRMKTDLHFKINQQREMFDRKLQGIARLTNNRGLMDAWEFYTRNQERFKSSVYVPFLHLRIPNERDLIFFNNVIGTRDLAMFIFTNIEDQELLMGNGNPYKINATIVDENQLANFVEPAPLPDNLKQKGFTSLLSQLYSAPKPVVAYLTSVTELDRIPIGGQCIEEDIETIAAEIGRRFHTFMTTSSHINVRFSKYSNKSYITRRALARNFRLSGEHTVPVIDTDTKRRQLIDEDRKIAQERERLGIARQSFLNEFREFSVEQKADSDRRNKIIVLKNKRDQLRMRLDGFSAQKPDLEQAEAAFEERKRRVVGDAIEQYKELIKLMDKQRRTLFGGAIAKDEHDCLKNRIERLNTRKEELSDQVKEAQREHSKNEKEKAALDKEFSDKCEELANIAGLSVAEVRSPRSQSLQALENEFEANDLPENLEGLDNRLEQESDQLDEGHQEGTRMDVTEYEDMKIEKTQIENEIEQLNHDNDEWQQQMDEKLENWLTPLRQLVSQISRRFSQFFKSLQCAGEVTLTEPENKYSIDDYGITIMVKFREGNQLRPLSAQTQSGGERSVSTMCYIMALQELCPVPFRCVDEINQGMDPDNERAVFNMMVALLSSSGNLAKTQYFMLTPKLLNGLKFNNNVTVHVVHNGPAIENPEDWDPSKSLHL